MIANNESCRCYLQNKLPNEIKDDCQIGWVNKGERIKVGNNYYGELGNNYYLMSHEGVVTIEPMTIAWDWISKDLWKNLAFLNLTNYIRNEWDKRGKPDPDVNRKVDKYRWIRDNNWKRLKINKSAFWLDGASDEELARFKRYNNGEHWEDNWDKKRKNKDYGRVAINIR